MSRENLVRWIPWKSEDAVLMQGSESWNIAKEIKKHVGDLTCVDSIEMYLNHCEEKFDVILLTNVLKHSGDLCGSTEVLLSCKNKLRDGGRIIITCDNPLGMRYWAGMSQGNENDGETSFFASLQGETTEISKYEFTKKELEQMIQDAGLAYEEFYYPYPNTTYPMAIYSDSYLPHKGELNINNYYMGVTHMELFDETKAFDTIISQGMFPFFSNSYMVMLHK